MTNINLILKLIAVAAVCFAVFSVYLFFTAPQRGSDGGEKAAKVYGAFMGSYDGITDGLEEGAEEGKTEGLSAKDSTATLESRFESIARLEVLSASVLIYNVMEMGEDGEDFKKLDAIYGDVLFSVDMSEVHIDFSPDRKRLNVTIPPIDSEFRRNESETKRIAEYQKHSWTGSNEDAYKAEWNSRTELNIEYKEKVAGYDYMLETAEQSAIEDITNMVKSICGEGVELNVSFRK